MKALKRFTVRITMPECIHMSEYTDEHQTTTNLDTLMFIWDPFYDAKQTLQCTAQTLANRAEARHSAGVVGCDV